MPRFDGQGRIVSGIGSGVVAINRERIADGGVSNWLADGVAIYQDSRDNGLYTKALDGEPVKVSAQGANALAAGGGVWMAWLGFGGLYNAAGVVDPNGRLAGTSQEQDGRGAASPDGHIAITDSENRGFRVIAPNGAVTLEVTNTAAMSLHLLDGHTAVWSDQSRQPRARGLPSPAIPPFEVFAIRAVQVGTDWFVLAGTHTGLVLYPWHSAKFGWKLGGQAFYPAVQVIGSVVNVAYSHGAGEFPHELDDWTVDVVNDPKVLLGSPPDPPQPEGEIMVKAFEHPFWLTPFYSHGQKYGDTTDHVGNSILLVGTKQQVLEDMARVAHLALPFIVGAMDLDEAQANSVAAWWESGLQLEELGQKVTAALNLPVTRPVIAYLDSGEAHAWPEARPAWVNPERVSPSVQAYRNPGESIPAYDVRVSEAIRRVKGYGCLGWTLTPAFYTRNKNPDGSPVVPVAEILECMPLYEKWIGEQQPTSVMPFSDRRPSGMAEHPEFREWCRAFQYAVPAGRPNRFDYWKAPNVTAEEVLRNKLGQSRAAVVLEPYLRELILDLVDGGGGTPPEPPNPPGQWPNLLDSLQAVRSQYPAVLSAAECVTMLNRFTWKHRADGFGLLRKTGGNRGPQPGTGIECSVDWVVSNTLVLGIDCLIDAGNSNDGTKGPSTPVWGEGRPPGDHTFNPENWVAPVQP